MYKTVVFDLDGTLLNTLTDLADAGNRLCRKYGWPTHERQAYRYFVGNGIPKLVERLAPADQRTPAVLEAALADFKQDYGQHLRDTTAPYPGIPEMLAKLNEAGIEGRYLWKPMHLQPVFADYPFVSVSDAPVGDDLFARGVCLPSDTKMSMDDVDRVCEVIRGMF